MIFGCVINVNVAIALALAHLFSAYLELNVHEKLLTCSCRKNARFYVLSFFVVFNASFWWFVFQFLHGVGENETFAP